MAEEMAGENKRKYPTISSSSGSYDDDSDSATEEFMTMKVVFSQPTEEDANREDPPVASSQSTAATTDTANNRSRLSVEDIVSSSSSTREAEEDARNKILSNPQILHQAKDFDYDMGNLLWHLVPPKGGKRPRNKQRKCYPVFRQSARKGKLMGLRDPKENQMCVCYMGYKRKDAGQSWVVPKSQLVPMVEEEAGKISSKYMKMFLQTIRNNKSEGFDLVMEKVVLEELVDLCHREKEKSQELTTTVNDNDDCDGDTTSHTENDKEEDGADETSSPLRDNNNNKKLKLADVNDDDQSPPDHNRKVKQQTIRAGCFIRYCPLVAVAGNKAELVSEVHKVTPKEDTPLELTNGDMLEKDHRVQLVQELLRGKLVDNKHPKYQELNQYRLRKSERKGENPMEKKVSGFKSRLRNFHVETDDKGTASLAQDLFRPKFNSEDESMNCKIADAAADVSSSRDI